MSRQYLAQQRQGPNHAKFVHTTVGLHTEALLGENERLLEGQTMIIDKQPQELENANRMVQFKQEQGDLVRKLFPRQSVSLLEPTKDVLQCSGHEKVLLLDNKLLDLFRLIAVPRIRHASDLLALLPRLDNVSMLVVHVIRLGRLD